MNYSSDYQVLTVRSFIIKDKSLNIATEYKLVGSDIVQKAKILLQDLKLLSG